MDEVRRFTPLGLPHAATRTTRTGEMEGPE